MSRLIASTAIALALVSATVNAQTATTTAATTATTTSIPVNTGSGIPDGVQWQCGVGTSPCVINNSVFCLDNLLVSCVQVPKTTNNIACLKTQNGACVHPQLGPICIDATKIGCTEQGDLFDLQTQTIIDLTSQPPIPPQPANGVDTNGGIATGGAPPAIGSANAPAVDPVNVAIGNNFVPPNVLVDPNPNLAAVSGLAPTNTPNLAAVSGLAPTNTPNLAAVSGLAPTNTPNPAAISIGLAPTNPTIPNINPPTPPGLPNVAPPAGINIAPGVPGVPVQPTNTQPFINTGITGGLNLPNNAVPPNTQPFVNTGITGGLNLPNNAVPINVAVGPIV